MWLITWSLDLDKFNLCAHMSTFRSFARTTAQMYLCYNTVKYAVLMPSSDGITPIKFRLLRSVIIHTKKSNCCTILFITLALLHQCSWNFDSITTHLAASQYTLWKHHSFRNELTMWCGCVASSMKKYLLAGISTTTAATAILISLLSSPRSTVIYSSRDSTAEAYPAEICQNQHDIRSTNRTLYRKKVVTQQPLRAVLYKLVHLKALLLGYLHM